MTEFDIGEFFIRGEAREVEGEFQAVIVMRAKPPLTTVSCHQCGEGSLVQDRGDRCRGCQGSRQGVEGRRG